LRNLGKRLKLGRISEPTEASRWTKAKRADVPIWLSYALIFLGLWFILVPAGLALGVWYFYGVGFGLTVVVGLLTDRYRQETVEQGEGYSLMRLEYRPLVERARERAQATQRAESRSMGENHS
jgi:hypothetical protein